MPDQTQGSAQRLCAGAEIAERGDAHSFEVLEGAEVVPAFVVRHEGVLRAYVNRCAHVATPLDWLPGKVWDHEQQFLICALHGALYEPPTGRCVSGPCFGEKLISLSVEEREGQVYWYPSERFQPVFQ